MSLRSRINHFCETHSDDVCISVFMLAILGVQVPGYVIYHLFFR